MLREPTNIRSLRRDWPSQAAKSNEGRGRGDEGRGGDLENQRTILEAASTWIWADTGAYQACEGAVCPSIFEYSAPELPETAFVAFFAAFSLQVKNENY